MSARRDLSLGAHPLAGGRCAFRVWAPLSERVELHLVGPEDRLVPLERRPRGYHEAVVDDAGPGAPYFYRVAGGHDRPDPATRFQPRGVHGPSQVVSATFPWDEGDWRGIPQRDLIFYELHVGTFSPEGTFDGVAERLDRLVDLGITAVELMPVAQFPGNRNWGYDGVNLFAAHAGYGGPEGLKRLVQACHRKGLALFLDVVYNHLGPEGNYLGEFGPYFTERYKTPWGSALNFDGPGSDEVRNFFIESALSWIRECRVDGLRLDALHAIIDRSARPFIEELAEAVACERELSGRRVHLVAEDDANDPRLVRSPEQGGASLDARWNDDFHHSLHVLLTGERDGYYRDFGALDQMTRAMRDGFAHAGEYSEYRDRRHGRPAPNLPAEKIVVFSQNHDQVGNRLRGDRLAAVVSFDALKLAAGVTLCSPFLPLLFMGEEYGETAPFLYFTSHGDPDLVHAVREGRKSEFAAFGWSEQPPDPQDEATFERSRPDPALAASEPNARLLAFYRELMRLRREHPVLSLRDRDRLEALALHEPRALWMRRWREDREILAVFHFGDRLSTVPVPVPPGRWHRLIDSAEPRWGGGGSRLDETFHSNGSMTLALGPWVFVLLDRVDED